MSQETNTGNSGSQTLTADRGAGPQLKILNQYIRDLSFENPKAPQSVQSGDAPDLEVEVGVVTKMYGENVHEVTVNVAGIAKSNGATHYQIELSYAGLFELSGFSKDQENLVLLVNCTGLLFPFIRNIFGEMTRQGGFAPVWLDPIDWGTLYAQRMGQLEQVGDAGNAAMQNNSAPETVN